MKNTLGRVGLLFTVLVALVVTVLLTLAFVSERERDAALDRLQKPASVIAYEQLTAALAPHADSGAASDEAATPTAAVQDAMRPNNILQRLSAWQRLFEDYEGRLEDNPEWDDFRCRWCPFSELSDAQQAQLIRLLETHQDLIMATRQMAALGGTVYPLDFSQGITMLTPHHLKLRHLAQARNRRLLLDAYGGEAAAYLHEFNRLRNRGFAVVPDLLAEKGHFLQRAFGTLYAGPLGGFWSNRDEAAGIELLGRSAEAAALPYYQAKPVLAQLDAEIQGLSWTRVLSKSLVLDTSTRTGAFQALCEAIIDLMQIGLLLEQHYVDQGVYPESLDPIASSLGGTLPVDPFTGRPYLYKPSGDTFLLYSLGQNETDDGGTHHLLTADIVWRGRLSYFGPSEERTVSRAQAARDHFGRNAT